MRTHLKFIGGGFAAFLFVAVGCGDDGDTAETGFGSGEHFSIAGALRQIPIEFAADFDGNIELYVADLMAADDAMGQSRPTGLTDADAAFDWLEPMIGREEGPVFVPVAPTLTNITAIGEYKDEVGFAVTEADATIESPAQPLTMTVVAGDLQHASATEVAEGVFTIGQGDDFEIDLLDVTAARPLGRPLRAAPSDGLVLLSTSTDAASAWLDAASVRLDSDEAFALAAEILDRREVIGAALFRRDFSAEASLAAIVEDGTNTVRAPIATSFDTIAVGWGEDDGNAAITVVYVTVDETAAAAAAAEIEAAFSSGISQQTNQPIADLVIVDDVTTDGRTIVVSLHLPDDRQRPIVILEMIVSQDVPFIYG